MNEARALGEGGVIADAKEVSVAEEPARKAARSGRSRVSRKRLKEMEAEKEFALEAARSEAKGSAQRGVALAAGQLYETLLDFDVAQLKKCLKANPKSYPALVGAIARLSQAEGHQRKLELELIKHQDKVAEQKARLHRDLKKKGVPDATMEELTRQIKLL